MKNEEAFEIFKEAEAVLSGHFLLTSGRHSDTYMQCAKLFTRPDLAEPICRELAAKLKGMKFDLVASPAIGGIIMGYEMSRQLKVPNVFAERVEGALTFRRGFAVQKDARVLIVEDVVTTGGSVREVAELVTNSGGVAAAIASVVDRSAGQVDFGIPYFSLLSMDIKSYEPEECPICKAGKLPLVKPGRTGK